MRIYFEDDDRILDEAAQDGETISKMLQRLGIDFPSPCGGKGTCGKCALTAFIEGEEKTVLACTSEAAPVEWVRVPHSHLAEIAVEGAEDDDAGHDSRAASSSAGAGGDADAEGYGIAFDIGTTTIVTRLVRLADGRIIASRGKANPQATFGADVISRITACSEGKLDTLSRVVTDCLHELAVRMCARVSVDVSEIKKVSIAGNTVMESIAVGIDPTPIGIAPFTPPSLFGEYASFSDDFPEAYVAPCVAGYVGGDIVCGALSIDLLHVDEPVLFVDLGTNGEMVLADATQMISCATAAGPVFEGAGISYGMPAAEGAVDSVAYTDEGMVVHVIGDGEAIGICGSGLISGIAAMLDAGVIDETGRLVDEEDIAEVLAPCLVEIDGLPAFRIADGVYITQRDVRNVQLAKGSVCAGIETLMEDAGIKADDISALYIAGGLGTGLDINAAARIGLFPEELADKAQAVGNTSLKGACDLLLAPDAIELATRVAHDCKYIELSCNAAFTGHYIENMIF